MSRLNKIAFFLICAVGVVTTLAYGTVHQPVIALFYLAVAALALIFVMDSLLSGTIKVSVSRLQIPLLLLGLFAIVQTIPFGSLTDSAVVSGTPRTISLEPFATRVVAVHIFALSTFFLVTTSILDTAGRIRRLVNVLTIFGFGYAFFAILQSVLSPDKIYGIYQPMAGVPFGSFVNRHDFAAIMEMTIALPLGLLFTGALRSDKRLVYIVAIAIMGASLLLSGSRGGLVALSAEIILLIILTSKPKGTKSILLKSALSLALVAAAVAGAVFVGGDTSLTRFSETAGSDNVTSSRTQIWSVTLKVITQNLPFGAGLGAFPQAYAQFDPAGGYERVEQAHNDYLQIVADAGIVGAIIGCLFLVWFFRKGIKNAASSNQFRRGVAVGAFAGCLAILAHSLFDFVLHITAVAVMFLTLLGLLIASGREYEDDVDEYDVPKRKRRRSASVTPIQPNLKS
ncbi:MAG: O-antigen ligase family protein [Pyrinomonadaceae bacterium]